ncbi:hypothetical protein M3Y96_00971400 [Aphelenchoides besseyi]|nr:hypothetical protein M3Y96_00971400 [Aphelenchoides besseyi]
MSGAHRKRLDSWSAQPKDIQFLQSENIPLWRKITRRYARPFTSLYAFRDATIGFLPVIDWLPRYSVKRQLYGDAIGGIMFAIANIPQALAYSLLAGIPPISGLYSMLLASAVYPLFSTFPHGGPGPFSIIELMSGATAEEIMELYHSNATTHSPELLQQVTPSTIVSTLTFTIGVIYIICGIIRVHFLAEYFSEPLVSGFIVGGVFHIFIGQLDAIMGVQKKKNTGFGYLLRDLRALYVLAPQTNLWTLGAAGCGFLFLVFGKFILHPQIERCFPNRKIIIPYELILVIAATALSDFLKFDTNFQIRTIGPIPRELPTPALPKFFLIEHLVYDALALAIIQSAMHLSVAKVMSIRKGYHVNDNQELYALGTTLLTSGFFPVFPTATSLTGPAFMDECGVTSQVEKNEKLRDAQFLIPDLKCGCWNRGLGGGCCHRSALAFLTNVYLGGDCNSSVAGFVARILGFAAILAPIHCVWIVTFVATVSTDVIGGLGIGIAFQLFTIVARTQGPRWNARYTKCAEYMDVCVFQFESMLLFTNGERFKKAVRQVFGRWNSESQNRSRIFIFDCSSISEVDSVGMKCFAQILSELRKTDCLVYFVKPCDQIVRNLKHSGALVKGRYIFSSVKEAVDEAMTPRKSLSVMHSSSHNYRTLNNNISLSGL